MSGKENCVRRGGSWCYPPQYARVAYRFGNAPGYRFINLGFRLVRSITPAERLGELSVEEKK